VTFRRFVVVAVVALMAVASACTRPRNQVEIGASPGPATSPSGGQTGQTGGGGNAIQQAIAKGDFGTLKNVCGPAPSGQKNVSGGSQGATADQLTVGTFADPNNPARPGLDQELFDAGEVFTSWCNSLGGIAGRKIKLNEHDSMLTNYQPKMVQACQTDFMLVGGGAVLDDSGQKTRLSCLLPDIAGYLVTAQARGADLSVQPVPNPLQSVQFGVGPYIGKQFPNSTNNVGVITANLSTTVAVAKAYTEAAQHFGWKVTFTDQYNTFGEPSWTPLAQKIKDSGAHGIIYVGEPENLGLLVQALKNVNAHLDWIASAPNMYDPKLLTNGKGSFDAAPVYTWSAFVPFEEAASSPALQQYEALFDRFKPNGKKIAGLGLQSFSAWLLFAESVKACGAKVDRRCVYENAKKVTSWTAGGLQSASNPTKNMPSDCTVVIQATNTGFAVRRTAGQKGTFTCDPSTVVPLHGNYGQGVKLSDVGKSMSDLT
jgi:hypothetical protein